MTMKRSCNVIVLVLLPSECESNVIVVRNKVLLCSVIDHVTLTFEPKTVPLVGYPKVIPYTKFEHFGIIRFLSYAADKQTNRLTRKSYPRRPT